MSLQIVSDGKPNGEFEVVSVFEYGARVRIVGSVSRVSEGDFVFVVPREQTGRDEE